MAVVWIFRVAVALTPAIVRACSTSDCDAHTFASVWGQFERRFFDSSEDPAELSAEMSVAAGAPEGGLVAVTDFTGDFELRKLQWRLSRAPGSGRTEDVDVLTFHFIKASGGTPSAWVDSTDLPALETKVGTYWGDVKTYCHAFIHSDQYRWYKDGPAFYHSDPDHAVFQPNGDNPAIRVTEVDTAGGNTSTSAMPPQVAATTTEKTSSRRHWGRWYLPISAGDATDATGILTSTNQANILTRGVTFYNSCRSSGYVPVVFSLAKNERPKKPSGTLPAVGAVAYEVLALQVDDILDIIRSRRYRVAVNKTSTTLT